MALIPVYRLIKPITRDELLEDLIEMGDLMKLRASSWRGPARWFLVALAEIGSRCSVQTAKIAANGYLDSATGLALTKLAKSQYDEDRILSTKARGILTVTDIGGVGPINISAGSRIFSPVGEFSNITFRNVDDFTIPLNSSVEIEVVAESGGREPNGIEDYEDWDLNPVIAGIEVTSGNNWLTVAGDNEEEDAALRLRCRDRWAVLGGNAPAEAYRYWATSAVDGYGERVDINRAKVEADPPGDGTLTIYIASASGEATAGQISAVQDYIDSKKPVTAEPTVVSATGVTVTIQADVTLAADVLGASDISDEIDNYLNSLDIGESVLLSEIITRIKNLDRNNVINVVIVNHTSDISLSENEVAVGGFHIITIV